MDDKEPLKVLKLGKNMSDEPREAISTFLKQNLDVFAWKHSDMEGIDPKIICHRLNLDSDRNPVKQKRHVMDAEQYQALKDVIDKLLACDFIKESYYPSWLANPVLVRKPNDKWRSCMDFTNLFKACPKDRFSFPCIDQLMDATLGHQLLSFMNAYSGYNQIPMHILDQEHTSFIIDHGLYCYKVMPFGLKDTGVTYQHLVNMRFKEKISKTMEVYVNDVLVKSKVASDHIAYLADTFNILMTYRMKLNPLKYVFNVASKKFLGFMVN